MLSTPFNFIDGQTLNYREFTGLRSVSFIGEQVSVAAGAPNPWMLLSQAGLLLLFIFVVDATRTAWRRGADGVTLGVGASAAFFLLAGLSQSVVVFWGGVDIADHDQPVLAGCHRHDGLCDEP